MQSRSCQTILERERERATCRGSTSSPHSRHAKGFPIYWNPLRIWYIRKSVRHILLEGWDWDWRRYTTDIFMESKCRVQCGLDGRNEIDHKNSIGFYRINVTNSHRWRVEITCFIQHRMFRLDLHPQSVQYPLF